jgi:hypothetical protein
LVLQSLMTVHLNMHLCNLPNSTNSRLPNIKYLWKADHLVFNRI